MNRSIEEDYISVCACLRSLVYLNVCIWTCVCVCMHIYVCIPMYIQIFVYT